MIRKLLTIVIISMFLLTGFINVSATNTSNIQITSLGNTIYVDDDALPEWYDGSHVKTINEGVTNASTGDTVYVYNGTYYEKVYINKKIVLTGENKETTIIDSGKKGSPIGIDVDQTSVSNFTLTNSSDSLFPGYIENGIDIGSDGNKIFNNIITNNLEGICLIDSSNNKIYDNIITENIGNENMGSGIVLSSSSNNEIYGNIITDNLLTGIAVGFESNENIISNNIVDNSVCGIKITKSSSNVVEKNEISNNDIGLKIVGLSNKNKISSNNFIDNKISATFKINKIFPRNIWTGNYWDKARTLPKLIYGRIGRIFSLIPWIAFDLSPVQQPYDI